MDTIWLGAFEQILLFKPDKTVCSNENNSEEAKFSLSLSYDFLYVCLFYLLVCVIFTNSAPLGRVGH